MKKAGSKNKYLEMLQKDNELKKRYMNVNELVEYTSLGRSFIYERISNNEIPFLKIRRRTVFDVHQIDEWMHNGGNNSIDLPNLPD